MKGIFVLYVDTSKFDVTTEVYVCVFSSLKEEIKIINGVFFCLRSQKERRLYVGALKRQFNLEG